MDHIRVRPKAHATVVDVGTADVDLDNVCMWRSVCLGTALHKFVQRKAADIGQNGLMIQGTKLGQFLPDHFVNSRIL